MGKCTVQLAILGAVNEIIFTHYSNLTTSQLISLLDALQICYKIGDSDLLQMKPHPTELLDLLIREETTAISSSLKIILRMYSERSKDREDRVKISEERLLKKIHEILTAFSNKEAEVSPSAEVEKVTREYVQIILQLLKGIIDFYDEQFLKHLPAFYPLFANLVMTANKEIRLLLKDLFTRAGKIMGFGVEKI